MKDGKQQRESQSRYYGSYFNQAVGVLQVRFERLEPVQAKSFSGQFFSGATLQQNAGYVDLLVRMNAETRFESYTASRPGGFSLILDVLPSAQRQDPVATPAVVIDAGHGGADTGLTLAEGNESDLTLQLAQRLSESLRGAGLGLRSTTKVTAAFPAPMPATGVVT